MSSFGIFTKSYVEKSARVKNRRGYRTRRTGPLRPAKFLCKFHKNLRKKGDPFGEFVHIFTNFTICEAKIGAWQADPAGKLYNFLSSRGDPVVLFVYYFFCQVGCYRFFRYPFYAQCTKNNKKSGSFLESGKMHKKLKW